MYARNVTSGVWKPKKKNKGIGSLCFEAFTAENKRRAGGVSFIHVNYNSTIDSPWYYIDLLSVGSLQ